MPTKPPPHRIGTFLHPHLTGPCRHLVRRYTKADKSQEEPDKRALMYLCVPSPGTHLLCQACKYLPTATSYLHVSLFGGGKSYLLLSLVSEAVGLPYKYMTATTSVLYVACSDPLHHIPSQASPGFSSRLLHHLDTVQDGP